MIGGRAPLHPHPELVALVVVVSFFLLLVLALTRDFSAHFAAKEVRCGDQSRALLSSGAQLRSSPGFRRSHTAIAASPTVRWRKMLSFAARESRSALSARNAKRPQSRAFAASRALPLFTISPS